MSYSVPILKAFDLIKKSIVLLSLLFVGYHSAAQVNESFDDSDYTHHPIWFGNDSDWMINREHQLQSNNTTANSTFYISTENKLAINTAWEFFVRLNFNTSSANYIDVYLTAAQKNLLDTDNYGYFIRIGNKEDNICLYRKDSSGAITKLIEGSNGITNHTNNTLKIKVTRHNHLFTLYFDATGTGNNYNKGGSATDSSYTSSVYFGFVVKQSTASFFKKHYFDDIIIQPYAPDTIPPVVQSVRILNDTTLSVLFSKPLEKGSSETTSHYIVNNNVGSPALVKKDATNAAIIYLTFAHAFSNNKYEMIITAIKDIAGNNMRDTTVTFSYYAVQSSDIIVNEILFNPKPNSSDYIELYNKTSTSIDISQLTIANRNSSGVISSKKKITDSSYFIAPDSYVVITEDADGLQRNYLIHNPQVIITVLSLPSFPNKEGTVVITNQKGLVIDEVHYYDTWHFSLLTTTEGVSLERINPDGPSQDKNNWHSSAASAGYGTPGYKNSQYKFDDNAPILIEVTPKIFSPDFDGRDDVATIQYQMTKQGYMANLSIFDASSKIVRYLVKNELLGTRGNWVWNGLDDKGQKLPTGTYIIYTEIFNLQGNKKQFKQAVVLARKER